MEPFTCIRQCGWFGPAFDLYDLFLLEVKQPLYSFQ